MNREDKWQVDLNNRFATEESNSYRSLPFNGIDVFDDSFKGFKRAAIDPNVIANRHFAFAGDVDS